MFPLTLFCPICHTYLGPSLAACYCGWHRPAHDLSAPGQPIWTATLGGPARGRAMVAGELVLFGWGNRQYGGGVTALNRQNGEFVWQVETAHSVEGGLLVSQDKIVFGTLGFLGRDAELRCHRLSDGALLWQKTVDGGVWSSPVAREERLYIGGDDGQVHCLDLRTGQSVSRWPVSLPRGRNWLCLVDNSLFVLTQHGRIFSLDLYSAYVTEVVDLDGEFKSSLVHTAGSLVAGSLQGQVYAIQPRTRRVTVLFQDCKSVVAAPYVQAGRLFVGGKDHYLRALDLKREQECWRFDAQHSIASSPVVGDGLVFVGGNSGSVYALDAARGELAWEYPVLERAPVLGGPAYADDMVYIGAENGQAYALPWHLGNYAWAAESLAERRQHERAAVYFALAAEYETRELVRKEAYCERAIANWKKAGQSLHAANFRESLLGQSPLALAREYEEAGKLCRDAALLRRAAEYFEEAEEREGLQRCNQMAGKLSRAPYLGIRMVNLPSNWEAGEEGKVYFDIKNRGTSPANTIRIRLAGNLAVRMWVGLEGVLPPGEQIEVVASIVPTGPGSLVIEPHFSDANGKKWSETRHFSLDDVKPSSVTLDIGGDVGGLWLDESALKQKIKIRGDAGVIRINSVTAETDSRPASKTASRPTCPACNSVLLEVLNFCNTCGARLPGAEI